MNFLLDTDTAVFWLRRNSKIRERLTPETLKTVAISIISLAELRYGANCSAHPEANHQAIDDFQRDSSFGDRSGHCADVRRSEVGVAQTRFANRGFRFIDCGNSTRTRPGSCNE